MYCREYAFRACLHVLFCVWLVETVHNFAPFALHPWRIGGSLVVMVRVPSFWIVTPWLLGQKIAVYPFSDILFMLMSDFLSPGSMSASLAFESSWSNGSCVLLVDCNFESSGINNTSIRDGPVFGSFRSSLMKWDVAPESMMMFCWSRRHLVARRLSTLHVRLFDVGFCIVAGCCFMLFISSSSCSSLLFLSSGAQ